MQRYLFVSLMLVFAILLNAANAQKQASQKNVVKGKRPPINLNQVDEAAYEQGVIKIKFHKSFTQHLDQNQVRKNQDGHVVFSLNTVDQLNKHFNAREANKVFNFSSRNQHTQRHREWGFHLWYRLKVDKNVNIKEAVKAYRQLKEVAFAEPEYKKELYNDVKTATTFRWTPNDPRYDEQWHYHNTSQTGGTEDADIDLPEAWDIEKGHSDVVISIQDGGIQTDHPDLAGNIWSGVGYNFVDNTSTISPHDHGTHVAGTISAENDNNTGVSGIAGGTGLGDGVRLMSCQVFTNSSSGGFDEAPVYAADNDACISQNSWGYTSAGVYDQSVLDAIDYFNQNGGGSQLNGGITIYAAGNSDSNQDYYPGYYDGTFAVAATNHDDQKSWYSNYGDWVEISAPGGETNSVSVEGVLSTVTNDSYDFYQGTSMACPHTSGVASLIISYAYRNGVILNNTDVATILETSVDDHYNVNPGFIGQLGTGRLNALKALQTTDDYISGVINPQNFMATAVSKSQIDLSWSLNTNSNDVLLAYSTDGVFGDPAEGVSYTNGDILNGGGIILYNGIDSVFSHTSLTTGTTYHYKIWSFDGDLVYSSGMESSATTLKDIIFFDDFEDDLGWTSNGEWERNAPQGQGGEHGNPDPSTAFSGDNVLGLDLSGQGEYPGDYEPDLSDREEYAISPVINCTNYENVELQFERWLGVESPTYDHAYIDISTDGGNTWTEIWTNTGTISEDSWNTNTIDISSYANGTPSVQLRFSIGASDGLWQYAGWNIDDFYLMGTTTGLAASIYTTPGCNTGSATVSSNESGVQTFFITDETGTVLDSFTGDTTMHKFNGLDNGVYRGQVEKGGETSDLTAPATLTNLDPEAATSLEATNMSVCGGTGTTLSYNGGNGETFHWYTDACGATLAGTGNNLEVFPTVTTTYYGRWESTDCGVSDCLSITITVAGDPTPPDVVMATQTDICENDSTTLYFYGGSGGTFSWHEGSCDGTQVGTGNNLSVAPQSTTTYYGKWTTPGCGESTCESITVNVTSAPGGPSSVSAANPELCMDETTTLSYTGGNGETFIWYADECASIPIGTGNNLEVSPIETTTYFGRWVDSDCVSLCESTTINVIPETNITAQPSDIEAAEGDTAILEVEATGHNLTYQWRKDSVNLMDGNGISGSNSQTLSIENITSDHFGMYDVIITGDCGVMTSQMMELSDALGIQSSKFESLKVYPNPTTGRFTVELGEQQQANISIFDINGRTIQSLKNITEKTIINMSDVNAGIYILRIENDNQTEHIRLNVK